MSTSRRVKRFNEYKQIRDAKANACIRSIMWLLEPDGTFPEHTVESMEEAFDDWLCAGKAMDAALGESIHANYKMPFMPRSCMPSKVPEEDLPCMQAWAAMVSSMVTDAFRTKWYLKVIVENILASPHCSSHVDMCPCKFYGHRFMHHGELELLEPLGVKHRMGCECGGSVKGCMQVYNRRVTEAEQRRIADEEARKLEFVKAVKQNMAAEKETAESIKAVAHPPTMDPAKTALVATLLETGEAVKVCFQPEEGMSPFRVAALALAEAKAMAFEAWTDEMKVDNNRASLDLAKKAKTDSEDTIRADALTSRDAAQNYYDNGFNYSPDTGLQAAVMDNRKAIQLNIVKKANTVIAMG